MYLVVALVVTSLLCLVTAPFGGADEENQSMRALQLAHGHLLPEQGADEAGGEIDRNVVAALDGFDTVRMGWEKRGADFLNRPWGAMTEQAGGRLSALRWAGATVFAGFGNTAVYPPFLYLPAAVGWRLGEAGGLTVAHALRLARLLCSLSAVLIGWFALRAEPAMQLPLFTILLLPSVLFVSSVCSQDAVLVPISALAAAGIARASLREGLGSDGLLIAVTACLTLLAMARPPYLFLAVLLFLPRWTAGKTQASHRLRPVLASCCIAAAVLLWRHAVARFGVDTADEADPALQLAFLQNHPVRAAVAVLHGTGIAAADLMLRGLYVLGWNDLVGPWPLRLLVAASLLCAFLSGSGAGRTNRRAWLLVLLACGGAVLGISLAEYLIWTPPGSTTVYGILPRYWLPVLPFTALLCRGGAARSWSVPGCAAVSVLLACSLPFVAARMFYLEGFFQVLRFSLR